MRQRLVLAILAATAASVLPACGIVGGGGDTYTVTAYFPRAVSVFPSSDVRVLGLPAGEVTEVEVEGDRVRVELAIPSDIEVPDDARAQIVPQSLIGERYIQLSPAFKEGMTPMEDGAVIDDPDRIIVPVEPDEALAAIKEFLDSLDPEGIGDLVSNLDDDLEGNGAQLNDTLGSLSQLVETFAEKDETLLSIVESFDRLTTTLVTREAQLGEVLDAFAEASQVLADERESIGALVTGLADLSENGLRLVGEHSVDLRADIQTLADAAATIDANLSSVTQLLEGGAILTTGLLGAYNPEARAIDLRNSFSPLVTEVLDVLLGGLGLPSVCEIIPLALCDDVFPVGGAPTPAAISTPATTPVGSLMALLGSDTDPVVPAPGALESVGGGLQDAAGTLLGVGG